MKNFWKPALAMTLVGLTAAALTFAPSMAAESRVWADLITASSTTPLYSLGTVRQIDATDSTGEKQAVYVRFWGRDTTQVGEVLYDTTGVSPFNVTNVSPDTVGLFGADTMGVTDSTTNKFVPRSSVAGVSAGTAVLRASYGWAYVTGVVNVRMPAPQQKAIASQAGGGNVSRLYRAGQFLIAAPPGVGRYAIVQAFPTSGATLRLLDVKGYDWSRYYLRPFGKIVKNATKDSTLVQAFINCR